MKENTEKNKKVKSFVKYIKQTKTTEADFNLKKTKTGKGGSPTKIFCSKGKDKEDPRQKERKKYGQPKARKGFQFSKR